MEFYFQRYYAVLHGFIFLLRIIQRTMECLGCLHTSCRKRYSGWFYPFVTFFKMTQIQYLILTLTVYLGIILLIALATIAIQFLLGNSYFSFAILILLNMALFLGAYYSNVTFMNVILRLLNPTNLYITSGAWFMENDITLSFAGNEFWIIGVTGIWMILCVKIARNFKLYDRNVSVFIKT